MKSMVLIFADHKGNERFFLRFRGTTHQLHLWLERFGTARTEENASWTSLQLDELA